VTGLYRGTFSGLEPLTKDTPLTLDTADGRYLLVLGIEKARAC